MRITSGDLHQKSMGARRCEQCFRILQMAWTVSEIFSACKSSRERRQSGCRWGRVVPRTAHLRRSSILWKVLVWSVFCEDVDDHAYASSNFSMSDRSFTFTVQHVFYIRPPIDRVMLVGVVDQDTVKPGDAVVIQASGRAIRATAEAIERLRVGQIPSAGAGDQVALRFANVPADRVKAGDRVTSGLH